MFFLVRYIFTDVNNRAITRSRTVESLGANLIIITHQNYQTYTAPLSKKVTY